ncbi:hypothetical protein OQA88_2837 [Cercophora sp. LCS_1]
MSNYTAPAAPSTSPAGPAPTSPGPPPSAGQSGPPYLPQTAQSGGIPTPSLDGPICAVLLALFVGGAAANMTIFQVNRRHGFKFFFSVLLFGFCMARIMALAMRIAWSTHQKDANVAIAAQVFTAAGVLLLFLTNLVFAQRIIRGYHPFFGWHKAVTWLFRAVFFSVGALLIMVITVSVHSFFTLDLTARERDRDVQLFCTTCLAVIAALPLPIVLLALMVPRRTRIDRFGEGHFRTKFALLMATTVLLATGAIFRAAIAFHPRPRDDPAWYTKKGPYYAFNFGVEVVVVYIYVLSRFDKRFHVPDGSSAPGHYSCAEFGDSAAAVASAVTEFEKKHHRGSEMKRDSAYSPSKRSSGWSARLTSPYAAMNPVDAVELPAMPTRVLTADRRSVKSSRSRQARSVRSGSIYGDAPSEADDPNADLGWMARAMRELYGEEEYQGPRHSDHHDGGSHRSW